VEESAVCIVGSDDVVKNGVVNNRFTGDWIVMNNNIDNYASAVAVDYGFSQISSLWTQISTMQQNAGILLTLLIFAITIIFGYITGTEINELHDYEKYFIVFVSFFSIGFAILAFIFLTKILKPKKTELLKDASYYKKMIKAMVINSTKNKDLNNEQAQIIINTFTVKIISKLNNNLEKIIRLNQKNYGYCLNSCIISFFSSSIIIIFILSKKLNIELTLNSIFIILILIVFVIFCLTIKLILKNQEDQT
jgi:hypothetical protein